MRTEPEVDDEEWIAAQRGDTKAHHAMGLRFGTVSGAHQRVQRRPSNGSVALPPGVSPTLKSHSPRITSEPAAASSPLLWHSTGQGRRSLRNRHADCL
jgi:hypothetical protein